MIDSRATVLLFGWEGTLAYDSDLTQQPIPAHVRALVEPLLQEANTALRHDLRNAHLAIGGAAVPIEQLLAALEERIAAVYRTPFAMHRDDRFAPAWIGADRLARALLEDWIAGARLFLHRLAADTERLAQWLGVRTLPQVASLTTAASDVHSRAGAVLRLRFADGHTLFYKPRPVTGELLWAELNTALAGVDTDGSLMAARVIPGTLGPCGTASDEPSTYGWMEGLERGECAAKPHWRKAGALLCLAQQVGLSDLHRSNLLATRSGPAVLDAECLGGVTLWPDDRGDAQEQTQRSLLATGLLPHGHDGVDPALPEISGLFGGPSSVPGILLPCWNAPGDAATGVSVLPARLIEQGNLPAGLPQPLLHLPELLSGYLSAARALVSVRPLLLREGGWLDRLAAKHSPRIVHRSTLGYGRAISLSLAANVLGSEEHRRAELRSAMETTPSLLAEDVRPKVLEAEVETLLRLGVPSFYLAQGTRNLVSGQRHVLARNVSPLLPVDAIRDRLERLCVEEMELTVKAALASILFRSRHAHAGASL